MNPDRLRLELRAITVSLDAALRGLDGKVAHDLRLRALVLLDRLEAKIHEARVDGTNDLSALEDLGTEVVAIRLKIENVPEDEVALPAAAPLEPD